MAAEPLTASVFIKAPPERVYEYFTRPEAIVRWMGEYAVLEPTPGGQFTVDVRGAPVRGRYLELEPPNRLVVSWGYADQAQRRRSYVANRSCDEKRRIHRKRSPVRAPSSRRGARACPRKTGTRTSTSG